MTNEKTKEFYNSVALNGALPAHSNPGGYPILYIDNRDTVLCADCATALVRSEETDTELVHHFAHMEGADIECSECNEPIASAYGDPDND